MSALLEGARVRISGLVSKPELNGALPQYAYLMAAQSTRTPDLSNLQSVPRIESNQREVCSADTAVGAGQDDRAFVITGSCVTNDNGVDRFPVLTSAGGKPILLQPKNIQPAIPATAGHTAACSAAEGALAEQESEMIDVCAADIQDFQMCLAPHPMTLLASEAAAAANGGAAEDGADTGASADMYKEYAQKAQAEGRAPLASEGSTADTAETAKEAALNAAEGYRQGYFQGADARSTFRLLDANRDGVLSLDELRQGLADVGITDKQINRLSFELDVDQDGKVTEEEFVTGFASVYSALAQVVDRAADLPGDFDADRALMGDLKNKLIGAAAFSIYAEGSSRDILLQQLFDNMDTNVDGLISPQEFFAGLTDLGFPENEIEQLFSQIDSDSDAALSFTEFVAAHHALRKVLSAEQMRSYTMQIMSEFVGPVALSPWNKNWSDVYLHEADEIRNVVRSFKGEIEQIDHIGSTAVDELESKPFIDICVTLKSTSKEIYRKCVAAFAGMGYKTAAIKALEGLKPDNKYHIMIRKAGAKQDMVAGFFLHINDPKHDNKKEFVRLLSTDSALRKAYGRAKRNAAKDSYDFYEYTFAKTPFILNATSNSESMLHLISHDEATEPCATSNQGLPINDASQATVGHAPCAVRPPWLPSVGSGQAHVPPTRWTLSIAQWLFFIRFCMSTPTWEELVRVKGEYHITMYDIRSHFVVPWTMGTGNSIALLMNKNSKQAKLMLSHAWAGSVIETLNCMLSLVNHHHVPPDTPVFYCVLSMYQPEDSAANGLSITKQLGLEPFAQIIKLRPEHGMFIIHTTIYELYRRMWTAHEADECSESGVEMTGLFDLYRWTRRLNTMKDVDTEKGECRVEDREMLVQKIEDRGGFERLNCRITHLRDKMEKDFLFLSQTTTQGDDSVPVRHPERHPSPATTARQGAIVTSSRDWTQSVKSSMWEFDEYPQYCIEWGEHTKTREVTWKFQEQWFGIFKTVANSYGSSICKNCYFPAGVSSFPYGPAGIRVEHSEWISGSGAYSGLDNRESWVEEWKYENGTMKILMEARKPSSTHELPARWKTETRIWARERN